MLKYDVISADCPWPFRVWNRATGSMPVSVHNERNFIIAPVREHSRKPDEQYEKIERLYPGTRKLELFARYRQPGWDVFGNQVKGSIVYEGGMWHEG